MNEETTKQLGVMRKFELARELEQLAFEEWRELASSTAMPTTLADAIDVHERLSAKWEKFVAMKAWRQGVKR